MSAEEGKKGLATTETWKKAEMTNGKAAKTLVIKGDQQGQQDTVPTARESVPK